MNALRNTSGFLGTSASLLADINLVVHLLMLLVLCIGVAVQLNANRGKPHLYHWHDRLQAPVVVLNIFFILFVMIPSFAFVASRLPGGLGEPAILVPTLHAMLGLVAEGLGIYCLLAGFKILPRKIGALRYWMWTTFVIWSITTLFGIGIYILWYTGGSNTPGSALVAEHDADVIEIPPETPADLVEEHAEEPIAIVKEEAPEVVEEHAEEPVEIVEEEAAEVVEEHAEEPLEIEPAPTEEVVGEQVEEEAPQAAPVAVGLLRISDGQIHSDQVTLEMSGVAPLADGSVYEGWLQGPDTPPFSIGVLPVEGDAINYTFVDPEGRRLFDSYNGTFITVEVANDPDPNPSENIVYAGEVSSAVMEHVRHVVTSFPASPDGGGLALNALTEANLILLQLGAQQEGVTNNDLTELLIHAETTLNIIEGSNSPDYGDRDGDGEAYNPGDGFGLLPAGDRVGYLQGAADHAALARDAEGASDNVALHAGHVEIAAANAIERAEQLRDLQLQVLQVSNPADAADLVTQSAQLAEALLNGIDTDGDSVIAPVPGEGGIQTMYDHGQLMGSIEIFAIVGQETTPAAEPTPTPELIGEHDGDVTDTTAPAPADTPVPAPTPTPELVSEHDGG